MAKHDKTIRSLKRRPVPSDIKWDDVVALLSSLGFRMLKGSGSRRKFFHEEEDLLIICHQPHPGSEIDRGCARDICEKLTESGLI